MTKRTKTTFIIIASLIAFGVVTYIFSRESVITSIYWRYGTPGMQRSVIDELDDCLYMGMSKQAVWDLLGPGAHGPKSATDIPDDTTVSFNIRDGVNCGIDTCFEDGKLVWHSPYD